MADGVIDSLSIEIGASSSKAVEEIKKLSDALGKLKKATESKFDFNNLKNALNGINDNQIEKIQKLGDALQHLNGARTSIGNMLPAQILNLASAVDSITDETIEKIQRLSSALGQMRGMNFTGIGSVLRSQNQAATGVNSPTESGTEEENSTQSIKDSGKVLSSYFSQIADTIQNQIMPHIKNLAGVICSAAKEAGKLAKNLLSVTGRVVSAGADFLGLKSIERAVGRIKNILSSLGRIAFYRLIRSAIKAVTDALKEGSENAYHFSKEFGDATHYISEALDQLSSAQFKMSNQLGAAWDTLLAAIQPILMQIISIVTRAIEVLTQFFAILGGRSTYMKAIDYSKELADTTAGGAAAAKEWKNQLMGFDEINRLEEPSNGGGGGGGASGDYGNMFEEAPVNDFLQEVKDLIDKGAWKELGTLLGNKFNEAVNSVDWKGIGKNIGYKLNGAITTSYYFLKTADFKNLGKRIAEMLNSMGDEINFNTLGRLATRVHTALWDFLYGAIVNLNWKQLAINLSDLILGALEEMTEWLSTLDGAKVAKAFKDFFSNIKWEEIGRHVYDLVKEAFKFVIEFFDELLPIDLQGKVQGLIEKFDALFGLITGDTSFKDFLGTLSPLEKVLLAVASAIGSVILGVKLFKGATEIVGIFGGAIKLLTNPVGLAVAAIGLLVFAGIELYEHWDEIKDKVSEIWQSIKDKAEYYFGDMFDGIKKTIDGIIEIIYGLAEFIAGVFTGDWAMAWQGVKDIFRGVYDEVTGLISGMFGWISGLIQACAEAISWLQGLLSWKNAAFNQPVTQGRINADTKQYDVNLFAFASGGFPEDGLFMANHGELVGQFSNGKTAVANNEQIVSGISEGVFEAVLSAMNASNGGSSNQPINIYLDGRQIAQSTTKYQNQFARASGA